jgi:hypothetical protein
LPASPVFVKLHEPLVRESQMVLDGDGDAVFASQHSAVDFDEQRFGFSVLFLPGETFSKQAFGAVSPPVVRLYLLFRFQRFSRERLALCEFA